MVMTMSLPCFNFWTTSLSVLSLITIFLCQTRTEAHLYYICPNTTTFTNRPDFSLLFESLAEGIDSTGFNTVNRSAWNSSVDFYGLVLCRGDFAMDECKDCVYEAKSDVPDRCPIEKTAVFWYDQCMVRYSNKYILSSMVTHPAAFLVNTQNISEQDRFDLLVTTTMKELASEISNVGVGDMKFATKEANFAALQTLYTLAQCTSDLSGSDCNRCLERAIATLPGCCGGKRGARLLYPSCILRFEVYPFYKSVAHAPPPHGSVTGPKGKDRISSPTIIVVVVPISVAVLLFVVGYRFHRRQRNMYNAAPEGTAANDIATVESLQFDLVTIETATNMFSDENKLGKGGFGAVYKAWKHWTDGTPLELLDPCLEDSYSRDQVIRRLHIGLLSAQYNPDDRPTMASIVLMLNSPSVPLPLPLHQPGSVVASRSERNRLRALELDQSKSKTSQGSVNEASITVMLPR